MRTDITGCNWARFLFATSMTLLTGAGSSPAEAQPLQTGVDTAWTRVYPSAQPTALEIDVSGNILVAGNYGPPNPVRVIVKYRPNGDIAWIRTLDGCRAWDLATDHHGSVYVTGYETSKYDSLGSLLWTRVPPYGKGIEIIVDTFHNSYVKGHFWDQTHPTGPLSTTVFLKYDSTGSLLRSKIYSLPLHGENFFNGLAFGPNNSIYATTTSIADTSGRVTLIKYDANLDAIWSRSYHRGPYTSDFPCGLSVDTAGNAFVTGGSCTKIVDTITGECYSDTCSVLTLKYSSNGGLAWVVLYREAWDFATVPYGSGLALDRIGNAYVNAYVTGGLTTIKYMPNGQAVWTRTIPGAYPTRREIPGFNNCIALDALDNVYVCGTAGSSGEHDYVVAKHSTDGNTEWTKYLDFGGGATSDDWGMYLALDSQKNVYVTGAGSPFGEVGYIGTAKLTSLASITGRVIYVDGTPIAGAVVTATGDERSECDTTDTDGVYSIVNLTPGQYAVQACIDRELDGLPVCNYYTGGNNTVAYTEVEVASGAIVENVDVEFPLPIILVHGWNATSANWNSGKAYLEVDPDSSDKRNGTKAHECFAADNIDSRAEIATSADSLDVFVRRLVDNMYHGAAQSFNIVAHSLGGIISRKYIDSSKYSDADAIKNLVMLGTPNAGVKVARLFSVARALPGVEGKVGPVTAELSPNAMLAFNRVVWRHRQAGFHYFAGRLTRRALINEAVPPSEVYDTPCAYQDTCSDGFIGEWSVFQCQEKDAYCLPCLEGVNPAHTALNDKPFLKGVARVLEGGLFSAPCGPTPCIGCGSGQSTLSRPVAQEGAVNSTDIIMDTIRGGNTRQYEIALDPASWASLGTVWTSGRIDVVLYDPDGTLIDSAAAANTPGIDHRREDAPGMFPHEEYVIDNPVPGTWILEISGDPNCSDTAMPFLALASLESQVVLLASTDKSGYGPNQPVIVAASLRDGATGITGAVVYARFVPPNGTIDSIALVDDGTHEDGGAGDGVYGNVYQGTDVAGRYVIYTCAHGQTLEGDGFSRSLTSEVEVMSAAASFGGSYSDWGVDTNGDGVYDSLRIEVGVEVASAGTFDLFGILEDGHRAVIDTSSCHISGEIQPGSYTYNLDFSGEAIGRHGEDGPYFLTDLTIYETSQTITPAAYVANAHTTVAYAVTQFPVPCCVGRVGNANGIGTYPKEVTISDIQLLVTAKFISSKPCTENLPCLTEADANQTGGASPACKDITISDIQTLVNHLFIAGPANAPLKTCL